MSDSMISNECREIRDLIPLFPADLEESEAARVGDHVASCAACAAELGVFMAQAARFVEARAARGAPKIDLWAGVQARLREETVPAPRGAILSFSRLLPAARTAIAAGLLVGLGFLAAQRGNPTPGPAVEPKNPIAVKATPAPVAPGLPARPTRRRGPTFFEERATPVLPSGVPVIRANDGYLDEEAELPSAGTPRRWLDSQPGNDDDRARSF